jgi:hypothetical protein
MVGSGAVAITCFLYDSTYGGIYPFYGYMGGLSPSQLVIFYGAREGRERAVSTGPSKRCCYAAQNNIGAPLQM